MKFALNMEYGNRNSKDRVTAFISPYDYFNNGNKKDCKFNVNALILTTKEFDIDSNEVQIVTDSCSMQYRPKGLHSNTKGIFYKINGRPIYLDEKEVFELEYFIEHCIDKKETILSK